MSAHEILQGARELIADPNHFCQGSFALNADVDTVSPDAVDACRWCASGAITRIGRGGRYAQVAQMLLREGTFDLFGSSFPTDVNDGVDGHARILAAFAYAIELSLLEDYGENVLINVERLRRTLYPSGAENSSHAS